VSGVFTPAESMYIYSLYRADACNGRVCERLRGQIRNGWPLEVPTSTARCPQDPSRPPGVPTLYWVIPWET
jgi:hypothetical protein